MKEIFYDSDTKVALLSGAPLDDPTNSFLSNDQIKAGRRDGQRCQLGRGGCCSIHWSLRCNPARIEEEVDRVINVVKPTSWKCYTIGDPLSPQTTKYPFRLDDEKVMYPFYQKAVRGGNHEISASIRVCLPKDYETSIPGGAWKYTTVDDVPKAAKDWPRFDFIIYHSALQPFQENADSALAEFERSGNIKWINRHGCDSRRNTG